MARLLFHSESINERGSAAALYEYIKMCKSIGHEVSWAYSEGPDNDLEALRLYSDQFDTIPVQNFEKFSKHAEKFYDWVYFLKKGSPDGYHIKNIPNNIHVIFQYFYPHGENYAYISEWLAKAMARSQNKFVPRKLRPYFPYEPLRLNSVPFSVNLPAADTNLRDELKIPLEAKVCLRFGGQDTFDIPWVKKVVVDALESDPNFWFLGVNTKEFVSHPRALFTQPFLGLQRKANMLATCDFVLHGRRQGESFGMTILESMQAGKPVLSWFGGWDRNHISLLDKSSFYFGARDLAQKLKNYGKAVDVVANTTQSLNFTPEKIFPKFVKVFGSGVL